MSLIDFHPYKLSAITASTKTQNVTVVNNKDKPQNDSEKKSKSFQEYLSDAEGK